MRSSSVRSAALHSRFEKLRLFVACLLITGALALLMAPTAQAQLIDRIAAVVKAQHTGTTEIKPDIITESEIFRMLKPLLVELRKKGAEIDTANLRRQALEKIIVLKLRQQKAHAMGIKVKDEDVQAIVLKVERQNNLKPGSLPETMMAQGMDYDLYKQKLQDKLLQSRLMSKLIRPLVTVTEDEIEDLHQRTINSPGGAEEIHLAHIMLTVDSNATMDDIQAIRQKAEDIVKALDNGEDFASLASTHSNDSSALNGGDMGWFKRGELLPEMENVVFDMEAGAIVGPVKTGQGIHIFKVLEKKEAAGTPQGSGEVVGEIAARHILIRVLPSAAPDQIAEAKSKIEGILQEYNDGADFSELAKKYSQDGSAKDGGSLGTFGRGVMVAPFEKAAFALAEGEVSQPVRTPFGWHLIVVDKAKMVDPKSYQAMKKELKQRLMDTKIQARYKQWLRDLRVRAFVEIH